VENVRDKKFQKVFEQIYNNDHLSNTPWFHILGNHDHYGNAKAQIDYTNKSKRW
jgi:tartrate-resistant acid phosphatase type 5